MKWLLFGAVVLVGVPVMELHIVQPLDGLMADLADIITVDEQGDSWFRYRAEHPEVTNPQLLRKLTGLGVDVVTLSPIQDNLESVYLRIVEEDEKANGSSRSSTS